ncbi:MAG TPA: NAD(P)H-dependent glycerol-3-phosphate dehydrogenase [Steroidobacteraceae bacterium]|jgi:glycerol-3-phosphate dehydrogenase (NAD(P)+)|nr:NAD(P)H-dependent glycerol-3-phosphate dehydrogenase [Steroidobacteraceae bacterium]
MAGSSSAPDIAVLGAGSWGTALAIQLSRAGRPARLWGRDPEHLESMARERCNHRYLPEVAFPESLHPIASLEAAIEGVDDVLLAVPSHGFRTLLQRLKPLLPASVRLCWATKGFELDSGLLPNQVAHAVLGPGRQVAVLSGPTFAAEVGRGLPTAMTIASSEADYAERLAHDLSTASFRAYTSTDITGVEVGGAVKNVLAIGAGLSDGMGFGANTRIALITRGLTEMTRLGVALGARRETFMGLAGLGDLVLTCTDNHSRNRRFGLALAEGTSVAAALAQIGQVVEGYQAARALRVVASREGVVMPIAEGLYGVLYDQQPVEQVVRGLMLRPIKPEFD